MFSKGIDLFIYLIINIGNENPIDFNWKLQISIDCNFKVLFTVTHSVLKAFFFAHTQTQI